MTSLYPEYQPNYPKEEEGGVRCMISEGIYPAAEMLTDIFSPLTNYGRLWFHESNIFEYLEMTGLKGEERYGLMRDLKRHKE